MSTLKVEQIQHPSSSTPAITLDSTGAMSGAMPSGGRNRIINGGFDIWQRGTSFSVSGWQADRFNSNMTTVSRSTDVPDGFTYSLSASSPETPLLQTSVELPATGIKGYITGQHTMSFYAKFDAGAKMYFATWFADSTGGGNQVTVVDYDGSTTPSFVGTGNWERYSFTFDISQTPISSNICLRLVWLNLNAGFSLTNFKITGVQLETGPVATPFEHRSYGDELARCQRYYYRMSTATNYANYGMAMAYSSTLATMFCQTPVTLRSTPSSVDFNGLGIHNPGDTIVGITAATIVESSNTTVSINFTTSGSITVDKIYFISNMNTTSGYLGINAEL